MYKGRAVKFLPNASKMVRSGQQIDTGFSPYYYLLARVVEDVNPAKCSAVPRSFWGLGFPVGVGWVVRTRGGPA